MILVRTIARREPEIDSQRGKRAEHQANDQYQARGIGVSGRQKRGCWRYSHLPVETAGRERMGECQIVIRHVVRGVVPKHWVTLEQDLDMMV